jgi:hypothetical protein
MKYILIRENSEKQLDQKVNSLFERGWIPQGGISVSNNGFYVQAMIKTI